jgi:hypothetical protein
MSMSDKADIKELAVAAWRLERWLDNLNADRKMAAQSALRSIKKYIAALGVEVRDPQGSRFDPGLAVEVISNEAEGASESDLMITETVSPYVYQNGELIQYARVIIGTSGTDEAADPGTGKSENDQSPKKPCPDETSNDELKINPKDIERMMEYAKIL